MPNEHRTDAVLEKNTKKNYASVPGVLLLPMLFGMSLTCLELIGNKRIATPAAPGLEHAKKLSDLSAQWMAISSSMFFSASLFSFSLFVCGMMKIKIDSAYKQIFLVSAGVFCVCSLAVSATSNFLTLFLSRALIGAASAVVCGLCPPYYVSVFGDRIGTILTVSNSFFISIGIFVEGQARLYFGNTAPNVIFYMISATGLISFLLIAITVKNFASKEPASDYSEEFTAVFSSTAPGARSSGAPWDRIAACLCMHVLQQFTGINPILSEQGVIFKDTSAWGYPYAKTFFNCGGLLGSFIGMCVSSMLPSSLFGRYCFLIGLLAGSCFIPLVTEAPILSMWSSGMYMVFFSMAIGGLPWMLPSKLISDPRHLSLAIGVGSTVNWSISGLLLIFYRRLYLVVGRSLFYLFMASSVGCGLFAWWILKYSVKHERRRQVKEKREKIEQFAPAG